MRKLLAALALAAAHVLTLALLAGSVGGAQAVTTSQSTSCQRDLAGAEALVRAVQGRDTDFAPRDDAKNCKQLGLNRADMTVAAAAMQRCLSGRDRDENVGQMQASLADIDELLARKCQ